MLSTAVTTVSAMSTVSTVHSEMFPSSALDAAAALIGPDGYLWMFGGSNGPGHSAAHPGVHSVGHRPSPSSLPSAVTPKPARGKDLQHGGMQRTLCCRLLSLGRTNGGSATAGNHCRFGTNCVNGT